MTPTTFTNKQMADWRSYERVRKDGRYNIYDPFARCETGMSSDEYHFVMMNYSELKKAVLSAK